MRNWKMWMAYLVLFSVGSACIPRGKKEEILAPKQQLYYRAKMFNKFLRWKAYQRAKMLVFPTQRTEFVVQCEKDRPHLRITDYKVRDVTEVKRGKEAIVLVVVHRHRLPSVSIRRVLEQQRWESKDGYWYFVGIKTKQKKKKQTNSKVKPKPTSKKS